MHNPLSAVAHTYRFDPEKFEAFALANEDKYKIFEEFGKNWVSNWFVDDLIRDFRALAQPENVQQSS